jgi:uncharacterized protein (TIGR00369 family)
MAIPTVLEADRERARVKVAFEARPEFCNAAGGIQGGFLTAMLDDCIGPAVLIASDAQLFPTTINLNVSFLAPALPGRLIGEAWVRQLGKTIGFAEAELRSQSGTLIATAAASVRVVGAERALAAEQPAG